jgi:hypothetical protein
MVKLSALCTDRLYTPRKYSWYSFLLEGEYTQDHSVAASIISVKNTDESTVNQTSDLPNCRVASHTKGTGSCLGVKRLGSDIDHPTPSSTEVKGRIELYIYSPSRPSWPVLGWTVPFKSNVQPQDRVQKWPRSTTQRTHNLCKGSTPWTVFRV